MRDNGMPVNVVKHMELNGNNCWRVCEDVFDSFGGEDAESLISSDYASSFDNENYSEFFGGVGAIVRNMEDEKATRDLLALSGGEYLGEEMLIEKIAHGVEKFYDRMREIGMIK